MPGADDNTTCSLCQSLLKGQDMAANELNSLKNLLSRYRSPSDGKAFFAGLGCTGDGPHSAGPGGHAPERAGRRSVRWSSWCIWAMDPLSGFFTSNCVPRPLRRSDDPAVSRSLLPALSSGRNLFVFSASGQADELAFVSLADCRIPAIPKSAPLAPHPAGPAGTPYRTDLDVLNGIRADGIRAP